MPNDREITQSTRLKREYDFELKAALYNITRVPADILFRWMPYAKAVIDSAEDAISRGILY